MNDDRYIEKVAEEQYRFANERGYEPLRYAPGDEKYGPSTCEECGVDLPTARREYGFTLCVICKSAIERK